MNNIMKTNGKQKAARNPLVKAFSVPLQIQRQLADVNRRAEATAGIKVGESFILRVALERLLKCPGIAEKVAAARTAYMVRRRAS